MSKSIPGNQKHLTFEDRQYIEDTLNQRTSFKDISRFLCKDPTTISKEIRKHRSQNTWNRGSFNNPYNFCIHRFRCKKTNACQKVIICDKHCRSCHKCNQVCLRFERESCTRLLHAPYVCNAVREKISVPSQRNIIIMPVLLKGSMKNFWKAHDPESILHAQSFIELILSLLR